MGIHQQIEEGQFQKFDIVTSSSVFHCGHVSASVSHRLIIKLVYQLFEVLLISENTPKRIPGSNSIYYGYTTSPTVRTVWTLAPRCVHPGTKLFVELFADLEFQPYRLAILFQAGFSPCQPIY